MKTSRRILLSLACMIVAFVPLVLWSLFGLAETHALHFSQLEDMFQMLVLYLLFALPGWLIALPFVVLLEDAQGWRGWFILLVGTCIGPGFMWVWIWMASPVHHFEWQRNSFPLVLSLMISLLTTVSYFLALRFAHRRSISSKQ